jgi:hypothetical protein
MSRRRLLLAALLCSALTACAHGSLYRGKHVHVGVRPAAENGAEGLTIQVSTDAMP